VTGAAGEPVPHVVDNADEHRYELWLGERRAGFIDYETKPGVVVLIHTEVDPAFAGRGLATRLIADAVADIRARGLKLVPVCPFVLAYLRKHREDRDLVVGASALQEPGSG